MLQHRQVEWTQLPQESRHAELADRRRAQHASQQSLVAEAKIGRFEFENAAASVGGYIKCSRGLESGVKEELLAHLPVSVKRHCHPVGEDLPAEAVFFKLFFRVLLNVAILVDGAHDARSE